VYPPPFTPAEMAAEPQALDQHELPVLPEAAATILAETSRAEWSPPKVIAALSRDPAMAAHLLRIANSPAFIGAVPVVSLQQAVTRLGASSLRQLAVVIACETKAFAVPGFEAEIRAVFRHSLAAGLFAKEIARHRRANVEEAFLAGLLHDVGWPVVVQAHATRPRDEVLTLADRLHGRAGSEVARAWKLPESIARAIEGHHATSSEPLTLTVQLADELARGAAANSDGAPGELTAALNLYPDVVEGLVKRGPAVWAEAGRW